MGNFYFSNYYKITKNLVFMMKQKGTS